MSAATVAHDKLKAQHHANLVQLHKDAWIKEEIVPDVVSAVPAGPANIYWGPNACPNHCHIGQELTATTVFPPPLHFRWDSRPQQFYAIFMVDPDAPTRQDAKSRSVLHWAVVNIPCEEWRRGDILAAYIGAGPPEGSGLHRYVFLVYHQKEGKVDVSSFKKIAANSIEGRRNFDVEKFLPTIGGADWELINGNFFTAKNDASVPFLYAQLLGTPTPDNPEVAKAIATSIADSTPPSK